MFCWTFVCHMKSIHCIYDKRKCYIIMTSHMQNKHCTFGGVLVSCSNCRCWGYLCADLKGPPICIRSVYLNWRWSVMDIYTCWAIHAFWAFITTLWRPNTSHSPSHEMGKCYASWWRRFKTVQRNIVHH